MSITIKTIGHEVSAGIHELYVGFKATEKAAVIAGNALEKLATNASVEQKAEALAGLVGGVQAQDIVRVSFAVIGELAAVLLKADSAMEANLVNEGFDQAVLDSAKQLFTTLKPQLVAAGVKL